MFGNGADPVHPGLKLRSRLDSATPSASTPDILMLASGKVTQVTPVRQRMTHCLWVCDGSADTAHRKLVSKTAPNVQRRARGCPTCTLDTRRFPNVCVRVRHPPNAQQPNEQPDRGHLLRSVNGQSPAELLLDPSPPLHRVGEVLLDLQFRDIAVRMKQLDQTGHRLAHCLLVAPSEVLPSALLARRFNKAESAYCPASATAIDHADWPKALEATMVRNSSRNSECRSAR